MASVAATSSAHAQLTANAVDTVTFDSDYDGVEMLSRDGAADVYFTVGSVSTPPTDPTVGGAGCYVLPAAIGSARVDVPAAGKTVVKLISAGTTKYSATAA